MSLCRGVIIFSYQISWKMERKNGPGIIMQRAVILDLPVETSVRFRCIIQLILSNPMGKQEREMMWDRWEPGLCYVTWWQSSVGGHALPCILHRGLWQALVWQLLGQNKWGWCFSRPFVGTSKSTSLGETDLRPPYNLETKLTGFGFHANIHDSWNFYWNWKKGISSIPDYCHWDMNWSHSWGVSIKRLQLWSRRKGEHKELLLGVVKGDGHLWWPFLMTSMEAHDLLPRSTTLSVNL